MENEEKYKIRNLDFIPIIENNEQMFIIKDPFQYNENSLITTALGYVIMLLLNGKYSFSDIKRVIQYEYNVSVESEQIMEMVKSLDSMYFLDNERFWEYKKQIEDSFKKEKLRESRHSNISYPEDSTQIREVFDSFFEGDFGDEPKAKQIPTGIIAPHIDLRIGGKVYASGYREIIPYLNDYDKYVILGTSHYGVGNLFTLTTKDFNTPLGIVETDEDFVRKLNEKLSYDAFEDEFAHRNEHSIEFQVIFLKHLQQKYSSNKSIKIIPVLFGSFMELAYKKQKPEDIENFNVFISQMKKLIEDEKTCLIASVDLAHIGKKFGDEEGIREDFLESVYKSDKETIQQIANGDKDAFWNSIVSENDKRKICGFSPIYTFLSILDKDKKAILSVYDKSIEEQTESMVSYAGFVF